VDDPVTYCQTDSARTPGYHDDLIPEPHHALPLQDKR
jgi:hypothetical protein